MALVVLIIVAEHFSRFVLSVTALLSLCFVASDIGCCSSDIEVELDAVVAFEELFCPLNVVLVDVDVSEVEGDAL